MSVAVALIFGQDTIFWIFYWDKVKAPVAELNETNWKALQCIGEGRAIWYGVLNQPNTNYADTQALIQPQMPQLKYELGAHRGQRGKRSFCDDGDDYDDDYDDEEDDEEMKW